MTLKPRLPGFMRSLRARVFFAILFVGMIPVVVAVGWLALYDTSNEPLPPQNTTGAVYQAWALGPEADANPVVADVKASLVRLRDRLGASERAAVSSHVEALVGASDGAFTYTAADILSPAQAVDQSGLNSSYLSSLNAALSEDQIRELRAKGFYWGRGTRFVRHVQPGADGGDETNVMWSSVETPIVAWMTSKDSAEYVQLIPAEARDSSGPEPMYWWYGALLAAGLVIISGSAFVVSLIAMRGVRKPLRLVTAEAEDVAAAGAAEIVPLAGPPEIRRLARAVNRLAVQSSRAQRGEQSFLLSVSHELKTPLTSLRGYGEGLKDGALEASTAGEVIVTESGRLERFVQDLLDSARFGRGEFVVKHETVDLKALARDVVGRHLAMADELGVELAVKADDATAAAVGDPDRVVQVVSNLVENAVRCTPTGGSVAVAVAPGTVSVADTGPGLGAEDLEHAFERFYLHNRYGRDRKIGTGLGLAIVKDLTEAMDGSIAVASEIGVGTTFTVRLPVETPPSG